MIEALASLFALVAQTGGSAVETVAQMGAGAVQFNDMLWRYETLMITGAAWTLIQAMQKGMPKMADHHIAQRLKPGASIFLCSLMAFLPSWRIEDAAWDETLLYGIVIGGTLGQGHKILSQTIFGKDRRIKPYVEDPELRALIDEYVAAKESGDANEKKKAMDHLKHWLT